MDNPKLKQNTIVVTGAAGRIGTLLRDMWGARLADHPILWSARLPDQDIDLAWNIGTDPAPSLPQGAVILHLAGQTRGSPAELAENRRAVSGLCDAALKAGAAHVFLMSSVAVYGLQCTLIDEETPPHPFSAYGQSKLAAEEAAQQILPPDRLTILRLGNLAGADTLLSGARCSPVLLDPIPGQPGGPVRSYIGPRVLAQVLEMLILTSFAAKALPDVVNLAQQPALAMADLLQAYGAHWRFGPERAEAVPCVAVSTKRLASYVDLPLATAHSVVADLDSLKGLWP